jgi:solute carrier family 25 S-adenosylmethionine transporter 26
MAGICVDLVLFPLDTIKTRIQATIKGQDSNFLQKSENISKYTGLRTQIFASFPSAAAFFSTYDLTKYLLIHKLNANPKYEILCHMLAAVFGEASAVLIRNPFELIKQNMQIGKYKTVKEALINIIQENGIRGIYRGYLITVFREIPFGVIQYPLYEIFKKTKKGKISENLSLLDYSICGAKSGGIAAFLTTPIDVIKTRIMTQDSSFSLNKIIPTAKSILYNEGFLQFFSGVHVRMTYISIGGMIFFGTNEFFKKQLFFH